MSVTAAQLATLGVVVAIVSGIVGVYYLARQSSRESARLRHEELNREIDEAIRPLREALQERTADRDYQRNRADAYEAELRRRDTR